jgi:hypothetical protein
MRTLALAALAAALLSGGRSPAQEKEVEAVRPLLTRFPHRAEAGPVTVYSDISKKFSEVWKELIDRMNKGEFKSNAELLDALQEGLKMDVATLEKQYIAYVLSLK